MTTAPTRVATPDDVDETGTVVPEAVTTVRLATVPTSPAKRFLADG